ncbi:protein O-linked-mannose beta-1,2-N-acetylglucosaminyltransferase 1-like [Macrobrachium rosenbergii]|uniref:protein O-linked-mannose beta-1,2-N-acetylglucosaminyltransferase 1-like n=1 Tax=Macrobrachium rosenbergii TaxID=79674 RepID=UPI0034D6B3AA
MLANLGSVLAPHLTLQAQWTWIFVKGGRTISETAIVTNLNNILQHSALPLCSLSELGLGNSSSIEQSRWQYCATEGGMGELCDEHSPLPLPVPSPPSLGSEAAAALANIPVILTAGSRHQYLRHTLTTLLSTPGIQVVDLFVILGDAPPPTIKLLYLLNVNYTILPVSGNYNNKLFTYYRNVYEYVVQKFAKAPAVIFLDEDVEVSPDFFSYMSQTIWLLKEDPSIYCINAFSATGFRELSYHPSRLFRGSVQVEWGYAISLNFIKEALRMWPKEAHGIKVILYDYFLYTFVSKDRECVFPEVGRSFHYGAGTNTMTNLITMERAFLNKTLLQDFGVKLSNVDRLLQAHWKEDLQHNISQATILVGNPCKDDLVPQSLNSTQDHRLFVFYYHLDKFEENGIEVPDVTQFYHLYSCFGAWSLSEQGQHKGVGILSLANNVTLYVVGVPYSPYSNLKPNWVPLWDIIAIPEEEFIIVDDNMLHREEFTVHVPNINMTTTKLISKLSGL